MHFPLVVVAIAVGLSTALAGEPTKQAPSGPTAAILYTDTPNRLAATAYDAVDIATIRNELVARSGDTRTRIPLDAKVWGFRDENGDTLRFANDKFYRVLRTSNLMLYRRRTGGAPYRNTRHYYSFGLNGEIKLLNRHNLTQDVAQHPAQVTRITEINKTAAGLLKQDKKTGHYLIQDVFLTQKSAQD